MKGIDLKPATFKAAFKNYNIYRRFYVGWPELPHSIQTSANLTVFKIKYLIFNIPRIPLIFATNSY